MSLAKIAVEKKTVTVFTTIVFLAGGIFSYTQLGQLEDPEFTVKTAVVTTTYPGASAEEVELEVTDRIEQAIQEMPQLKDVESLSRAGQVRGTSGYHSTRLVGEADTPLRPGPLWRQYESKGPSMAIRRGLARAVDRLHLRGFALRPGWFRAVVRSSPPRGPHSCG